MLLFANRNDWKAPAGLCRCEIQVDSRKPGSVQLHTEQDVSHSGPTRLQSPPEPDGDGEMKPCNPVGQMASFQRRENKTKGLQRKQTMRVHNCVCVYFASHLDNLFVF